MDFKLYGSPDTAQQILRMVSLTDGVDNLFQAMPGSLKDLGGRLAERVLPANGDGDGNGAGADNGGSQSPGSDLDDIRQMLSDSGTILVSTLTSEEQKTLTLREGIELALTRVKADSPQHGTLTRLHQFSALLPMVSGQKVSQVLQSYAETSS
jgi:hypothetical protein